MAIKDEKQNKKICEDENIQFNFIVPPPLYLFSPFLVIF